MQFGVFVRERREHRGLSLREASGQLGVDPAYLSRVESGKVPPSEQLIGRLASLLRCTEDELMLLAGRLPASLQRIVDREPYRASLALRGLADLATAEPNAPFGASLIVGKGTRAIEDGFPFETLSEVAEIESWRKEIYRPVYHTHKWWAQRLGSVFRAAILGAATSKGSSVMDLFYQPVRLPGLTVFDPFMGSGTTIGEAHKLGCTAIGRDINAVAYRVVQTALGPVTQHDVEDLFDRLAAGVGKEISAFYQTRDRDGRPADVLYYFWVKVLPCPKCSERVDLFSTYVFARHAYADRNPAVQVLCPGCGEVFASTNQSKRATCPECKKTFDPHDGPAKRTTAVCGACSHEFPIAKAARADGKPPAHRLYAKLILTRRGEKQYLRTTDADLDVYAKAGERLRRMNPPLPRVAITDGYNTHQILNYGYGEWHELFNDRQLLALSLLGGAIRDLPEGPGRDALAILFSGVLEFNNMFASYKGEGTGAVRHMFSHHILKPERMPIEANVWGTPKSSGSFTTLFRSRLLRALAYRAAPFEIAVEQNGDRPSGRKVLGISPPMGGQIVAKYPKGGLKPGSIYLSCGDSAKTDLPTGSVDLVVTDPPFFDNVHYSELADFFFVWQELLFGDGRSRSTCTTRRTEEVQDTDADAFGRKLGAVFAECHRVLKDDGLLVFSYHHSRDDGWTAVARAVLDAEFSFVASQPVKSEMSVAAPKSQAKEPIDVDVLLVCRKCSLDRRREQSPTEARDHAVTTAKEQVARFNRGGRVLSRNDVKVIVLSQTLVALSAGRTGPGVEKEFGKAVHTLATTIERMWHEQERPAQPSREQKPRQEFPEQIRLF